MTEYREATGSFFVTSFEMNAVAWTSSHVDQPESANRKYRNPIMKNMTIASNWVALAFKARYNFKLAFRFGYLSIFYTSPICY
jgi:hypothetical protein